MQLNDGHEQERGCKALLVSFVRVSLSPQCKDSFVDALMAKSKSTI